MPRGYRSAAHFGRKQSQRAGFTLVEMLVAVVILLILMGIIFQIIQMVSQAYSKSSQGTTSMQQARVAFERLTRNLSQATLNTYYDYIDANGHWPSNPSYTSPPANYGRQSELQYVSGNGPVGGATPFISSGVGHATQVTHAVFFQSPLGVVSPADASNYGNLNSLLNACGYFIVYNTDTLRPGFLNGFANKPKDEYRFRLMEYLQPSENLSIYTASAVPNAGGTVPAWISNGIPDLTTPQTAPITVRPLASNIVALIIMPEQFSTATSSSPQKNTAPIATQSTSSYNYDSAYNTTALTSHLQSPTANQLPPLVKVIMVAIDEPSAVRLANANPGASPINPPNLGQANLFQDPTKLFTNGAVEGDLDKFQDILNGAATGGNSPSVNAIKLNYFVFQTDVIIRGSKWTSQ